MADAMLKMVKLDLVKLQAAYTLSKDVIEAKQVDCSDRLMAGLVQAVGRTQ